jgi:hypothetical protein
MSTFTAEDQARFERQWARAVEAPQDAMDESLVAERWAAATMFASGQERVDAVAGAADDGFLSTDQDGSL